MKDRIKKLRKELCLTQQEFADRLNVKRQTVAAYEIGKIKPSDSTLLLMCKEFKVNKEWLCQGDGRIFEENKKNHEVQEFAESVMGEADSSFKKRFITALSKLNERDWETLAKIAEELEKEG